MNGPSGQDDEPGLLASLKNLGGSFLQAVQTRLEILSVELQEEKWRLVQLLLLAGAAVFLSVIAVITVTITIAILAGPEWRPYVLCGFSLLYVGATVFTARALQRCLRERPPPFASTLETLKKDREWLISRKSGN